MKQFRLCLTLLLLSVVATAQAQWPYQEGAFTYVPATSDGLTVFQVADASLATGTVKIPATVTVNGTTYDVVGFGYSTATDLSSTTITSLDLSETKVSQITINKGAATLTSIVPPSTLTTLNALQNCPKLTSLDLRATQLTTIGAGAFNNTGTDAGGIELKLPATFTTFNTGSNTPFKNVKSLDMSLTELTSLPSGAFYNCTNLTSITLPRTLTAIKDGAFSGCTNLTEIDLSDTQVSSFGSSWVSNTGAAAGELKIILPKTMTTIPTNVTSGVAAATVLTVDASKTQITEIAANAFNGSSIQNFVCPSTLETIGERAFYQSKLTSIDLSGTKVKEIPQNAFYNCSSLTSVKLPATLETIGYLAFCMCTGLTSVELPENVQTIAQFAFAGCSNLESINLPESIVSMGNAFPSTKITPSTISEPVYYTDPNGRKALLAVPAGITSLTIEEGTTLVADGICQGNTDLTSITVPSSLTRIPANAFNGCTSLTTMNGGENIATIGIDAFKDCPLGSTSTDEPIYVNNVLVYCPASYTSLSIKEGTTGIADGVFKNNTNLTSVTFPASLKEIGPDAFSGCTNLVTADLSKATSLTTIWQNAFNGCTKLPTSTLALPASCTQIKSNAFSGCQQIETLRINSEAVIGENAFGDCKPATLNLIAGETITSDFFELVGKSNLTTVTFPATLKTIGDDAFSGCSKLATVDFSAATNLETIGNRAFKSCSKLAEVDLSGTKVTSIGSDAFIALYGNTSLTKVTFPATLKTIGNRAFYRCSKLAEVDLFGTKVTSIGSDAFYYNTSLTKVTFPATLETIGSTAFYNCESLTTVSGNGGKTIGSSAFYNCSALTSYNFSSELQSIATGAFTNCIALKTGTFPDGFVKENTMGRFCPLFDVVLYYDYSDVPFYTDIPASYVVRDAEGKSIKNIDALGIEGKTLIYVPNSYTSLVIEDGTKAIIASACSGLKNLKSVEIPNTVETIGEFAFYNSGITSVDVPGSVKVIERYTFYECPNLEYVNLQEGVEEIRGEFAIRGGAIAHVNLPNTLKYIGAHFLCNCTKITSLVIPSSVEYIDGNFLHGCVNMREVYLLGQPAALSGNGAFTALNSGTHVNHCTFYVIDEDTYKDYVAHNVWVRVDSLNETNLKGDSYFPGTGLAAISTYGNDAYKYSGYGNRYVYTFPGQTREFEKDKWSTACFPEVSDNIREKLKAGKAKVVELYSSTRTDALDPKGDLKTDSLFTYHLDFHVVDIDQMQKKTPYLIKPEYANIVITDMYPADEMTTERWTETVVKEVPGDATRDAHSSVKMIGTYLPKTLMAGEFYLKNKTNGAVFNRSVTNGRTPVGQFKCYFRVEKDNGNIESRAKMGGFSDFDFEYVDEEVVTGVTELTRKPIDVITSVYTINGQRIQISSIDELPRGLYIVNGKKMFVK